MKTRFSLLRKFSPQGFFGRIKYPTFFRALLREIAPHPQGSSLSMFIGSNNEAPLLNYTRSILDFYKNFTQNTYQNCTLLDFQVFLLTQLNLIIISRSWL